MPVRRRADGTEKRRLGNGEWRGDGVDFDQYWTIAEQDIEIQNPVTDRKLKLLDDYCDIRNGLSVLDVGCGKAWVMRRWADNFAITGTGLDNNQHFLDFARARSPAHGTVGYIEG